MSDLREGWSSTKLHCRSGWVAKGSWIWSAIQAPVLLHPFRYFVTGAFQPLPFCVLRDIYIQWEKNIVNVIKNGYFRSQLYFLVVRFYKNKNPFPRLISHLRQSKTRRTLRLVIAIIEIKPSCFEIIYFNL